MKRSANFLCALILIGLTGGCSTLGDMATGVKNTIMEPKKSVTRVAAGLKEALTVSADDAVAVVSKAGGYFENEAIKIILPDELEPSVAVLRGLGLGQSVDDLELSMNNAAEQAAPQAKDIFMAAISDITFDDAMQILKGGDTAATDYLRKKTYAQIYAVFRPIIGNSMNIVGVSQQYKSTFGQTKKLVGAFIQMKEFESYITQKALEGLFHMVARGEKNIRKNPAARGTKLLAEVFS